MTMYARVEQGTVRELVETDRCIEELYHPGLFWVKVSNIPEIRPGWIMAGEGFSPPMPEAAPLASPVFDVAELARQVSELQEQIRLLVSDAPVSLTGRV